MDGGERMVELSGGSARPGMGVGFWPEPDEMRQIISFGVTGQAGDLGVYVCNSRWRLASFGYGCELDRARVRGRKERVHIDIVGHVSGLGNR